MCERGWASLEGGLLHDVFARLRADADAASFRHVCRGWRAAAGPGALVPGPWFALQSAADGRRAFVRPAGRRRVMPVRLDDDAGAKGERPRPACVRGASRGWLAMEDGERLFLRDPLSRAEVPLPDFDDPQYQMSDVFLSDDPLVAPGRWTAFAFFKRNVPNGDVSFACAGQVLASCLPGDADWARFDLNGRQTVFYWGLEFFRGRAYVLIGITCRLAVCDVDTRKLVASSVHLEPLAGWESDIHGRMVECGGELLVVVVARYEHARPSCCVRRRRRVPVFVVSVVRIKLAEDGSGMPVAASLVADTGDHALFVAPRGHAFALPASAFPAVRPSCVYHFATNAMMKNVGGMLVTDLLDRTQRPKPLRKLPLAGKWQPLSWLWPRSPTVDTTPARRRPHS